MCVSVASFCLKLFLYFVIVDTGGFVQVCTSDGRPSAVHPLHLLSPYVKRTCQWPSVCSLLLQPA